MAPVRVLIVDDQEPFRHAMAAVVEATEGFEAVGAATTGEESLEASAVLGPDLVLMDVNLPGIDGIEATRRLASGDPAPVVFLLSTYDEDQVDAAGCGAAAYIPKAAFGPDRLVAAWDWAVGRSARPLRAPGRLTGTRSSTTSSATSSSPPTAATRSSIPVTSRTPCAPVIRSASSCSPPSPTSSPPVAAATASAQQK